MPATTETFITARDGAAGCETEPMKVQMFRDITKKMADLYARKNHDYGDSFGRSWNKFGMVSALIRMEDKFNRLESLLKKNGEAQVNESIEDTLMDLANYAVMSIIEMQPKNGEADKG